MRKLSILLLVLGLLATPAGAAAADGLGGWSSPAVIAVNWWAAPSANHDATRVVFLDPNTSAGGDFYYDRRIFVVEYANGAWGQPILIASNGMNRGTGLMPVLTRPVISADGATIAYLGCTGGCQPFSEVDSYDIYVSRRTDAGWSAPAALPIDIQALDERIGLSADGNTLAFSSDYLNFPFYKNNQVYVIEFSEGTWGAAQPISSGDINGWAPALSQDGLQAVWLSNPPELSGALVLMYASREALDKPWSAPQPLDVGTDTYNTLGQYRFSPDGNSIFYWKYVLVEQETYYVCTGRNLYSMRQTDAGWGTAVKATTTPITPMDCGDEAPPAVDATGTRVIYPRTVLNGDSITGTFFEMTEYRNGTWSAPVTITTSSFPYYEDPQLSDNGARLVSLGPDPFTGSGALVWMQGPPVMSYWSNLALIIGAAR